MKRIYFLYKRKASPNPKKHISLDSLRSSSLFMRNYFSQLFILVLFGIFFISGVYALGCCVDVSNGLCSPNSDESSCSGGEFSSDASCGSVSECNWGCCAIGTSVSYSTQASCYFRAQAGGQTPNWQQSDDPGSCMNIVSGNKTGACLIQNRYGSPTCKFTTKSSCSGSFYENLLCSDSNLNTTCKKTDNTTCYGEEVHYLDSCGNPDVVKQSCSYDSGLVCQQQDSTHAFCKDLNCKNPLTGETIPNGGRWCVDLEEKGNVLASEEWTKQFGTGEAIINPFRDLSQKYIKNGHTGIISDNGLFLRDREDINLVTGRVTEDISDQCEQINAEKEAENKDKKKYSYSCEADPNAPAENVVYDPYTCEICDQSLDACGDNLCERCKNDLGGVSWPGRLNGCVSDNACGGGTAAPVGSRFFSQYCLNGDILNEPCDDFRMGFCDDAKTGGKCEINPWQECLAGSAIGSGSSSGNSQSSKESLAAACDLDFCTFLDPAKSKEGETTAGEVALMMDDLNLAMCVPKIAGGLEFYSTEGSYSSQQDSVCGAANYHSVVEIYSPGGAGLGYSYGDSFYADDWYIKFTDAGENSYGNSGVTDVCPEDIGPLSGSKRKLFGDYVSQRVKQAKEERKLVVRTEVVQTLMGRCEAIADCGGKGNWLGDKGSKSYSGNFGSSEDGDYTIPCTSVVYADGKSSIKCTLDFVCSQWKAPASGESCSVCGQDGLPCSEYRCKALGKGCDYQEPAGADKGYCVSSSDNTGPIISSSISPASPVPPFTSVEIKITTNEPSYCRFNIGSAGATIDDMLYDVDENWATEHKVILNVPGKMQGAEDDSQYTLITDDGHYNVYVRCEDVSGNSNPTATNVQFDVMQTPDQLPPSIVNFSPASGSFVAYNLTQKEISVKLNEPAQCKWSTNDTDYALMENEMSCDETISDYGTLNGYFCTSILTGLNTTLGTESKFYFRCKDQPWLEGKEDDYYKRNVNPASKTYVLKPSAALVIDSVTPSGELLIGPSRNNITLTAKTSGGSANGVAKCFWKLSSGNVSTAYTLFSSTNSQTHTNSLFNLTSENYFVDVKCSDSAGNIVNKTVELNLRIDSEAPLIAKIFNDKGNLKIITGEPAICKFVNQVNDFSCLFSFSNATTLTGNKNTEHVTPWKLGFNYLVRCQDFYGNINSGCGIVAKAVK